MNELKIELTLSVVYVRRCKIEGIEGLTVKG